MKQHQRTVGLTDEYLTPPSILKPLGVFDLDPCTCNRAWQNKFYYNTETDEPLIKEGWSTLGLDKQWLGRVWLNPPFNRYERPLWMKKMAEHGNGIMLIPAAFETSAFQKYVWYKANAILMLNHRPHFHYPDGQRAKANSGCTICLVAYGHDNEEALRKSDLGLTLKSV